MTRSHVVTRGGLHVICDVDRVQTVRQEAVPEMHALFLSPRVNGQRARVDYHHHTHHQMMLFCHTGRHQGYHVHCFALRAGILHYCY